MLAAAAAAAAAVPVRVLDELRSGTKAVAICVTSAMTGTGAGQSRRGYLAGWALQG
jgi:hypothetical protein